MVLAAGIAVGVPVSAQDQGQELSLAALLDIKLQTGSFLELDLAKSPLSMTVIDRGMVDLSGARDLSELLEIYVPGFQYMYNRWNGKLWSMRGVSNDRNTKFIVLVNGHKMNTEGRDGFFQEVDMGLFGDVERVEVLRGPAGLVYGSGAIAGIVNIVTRTAQETGGEVVAKAGAWSSFGNTSKSAQATVFGKIDDENSVTATLGWEKSDGLGNGVSRIYGTPLWPYPFWTDPKDCPVSVPADGSANKKPGNWKASIDYNLSGLRIYTRFTHQVQEGGGLFVKDPWPGYVGNPGDVTKQIKTLETELAAIEGRILAGTASGADSVARTDIGYRLADLRANEEGDALVDGKRVKTTDPFWGQTESYNNNRREYVADNIAIEATYDFDLGENTLKLRAGFDGNSNIIQREMRPGYESNQEGDERNSFVEEAMGERRYTLGAVYLMKNIPSLQLAVGTEQRFDDIGEDLFGRNARTENPKHKIVSDVLYSNTALFTEGWYDLTDGLGFDFGLRWDGHTRTIDNGGTVNGKLASVYTPVEGHTIKAIFQTSSNNGSADNYEYNRNHYGDDGVVYSADHFYDVTTTVPGTSAEIVRGVSEEELHKLLPEKVYSFELTSNHDLTHGFSLSPSVSYNMVRDLFAWSQTLFRVVNVGQYDNLNIDLQADWRTEPLEVGFNHGVQMVVNTDVDEQTETLAARGYDKTRSDWYKRVSDGTYVPVANTQELVKLNPVKDQITTDGENFMSMATHVSKLWVNWNATEWLTFHNDLRVFWGLAGRDSASKVDDDKGFNTLGIATDPIAKWNASVHSALPDGWSVNAYVYDILGSQDPDMIAHTLRWNQSYDKDARDLYTVDLRSYAVEIKKAF
ncbi:MAG: TonB-dependent receptor plug domain-containing protein [Fibrobacteria bacterium]|nr:TonB-dependent receptor plug domain-containing protein [Fibrobacteria bacterium]